jgi:hypothetical protein
MAIGKWKKIDEYVWLNKPTQRVVFIAAWGVRNGKTLYSPHVALQNEKSGRAIEKGGFSLKDAKSIAIAYMKRFPHG